MRQTVRDFTTLAWGGRSELEGLDAVILSIVKGAARLQVQVRAAGLADVLGATGEINIQGEMVQRLDAAGSDIFVETLQLNRNVFRTFVAQMEI